MANKKSTMKDVAKMAGVSTTTVSYVINNTEGRSLPQETRERVLNAISALDYTPNAIARRMKTQDVSVICVVYTNSIDESALNSVLTGIVAYAKSQNCLVALYNVDVTRMDTGYIEHFKSRQIDGIIFYSPLAMPRSDALAYEQMHLTEIMTHQIPVCVINGQTGNKSISYVNLDFYHTTYQSVEYLYALGHREIAYILPMDNETEYTTRSERIRGFQDVMERFHLPLRGELITCEEDLEEFMLLHKDCLPDAIVASKMTGADRFYNYANKLNIRIPEDISIISANYAYRAFFNPPLTTAYLRYEEIGECAAKALLNSISQQKAQPSVKIGCTILEGGSCTSKKP